MANIFIFFSKYQHLFLQKNDFIYLRLILQKNDFIYLWLINVMVYGFQKIVFFTLVVFILQKKTRYFSKYEHLFFNRIKKIKKMGY